MRWRGTCVVRSGRKDSTPRHVGDDDAKSRPVDDRQRSYSELLLQSSSLGVPVRHEPGLRRRLGRRHRRLPVQPVDGQRDADRRPEPGRAQQDRPLPALPQRRRRHRSGRGGRRVPAQRRSNAVVATGRVLDAAANSSRGHRRRAHVDDASTASDQVSSGDGRRQGRTTSPRAGSAPGADTAAVSDVRLPVHEGLPAAGRCCGDALAAGDHSSDWSRDVRRRLADRVGDAASNDVGRPGPHQHALTQAWHDVAHPTSLRPQQQTERQSVTMLQLHTCR